MSIKTDWISENLETVAKVKIPKTYISFNQFDMIQNITICLNTTHKRYLIIVADSFILCIKVIFFLILSIRMINHFKI